MLYYKKYIRHEHSIIGKRKKYDTMGMFQTTGALIAVILL